MTNSAPTATKKTKMSATKTETNATETKTGTKKTKTGAKTGATKKSKAAHGSGHKDSAKKVSSTLQAPPPNPEVATSRLTEDRSRLLFEQAVFPWRLTRWHEDFGIDAVVEIAATSALDPKLRATGKLFAVQLKATADEDPRTKQRIETRHLSYWLNHSLPVLLVVAHVSSKTLLGRWIDKDVLAALRDEGPAFWAQKTVTIDMTSAFVVDSAALSSVQDYVDRAPLLIGPVAPAAFFELRREAQACVDKLANAVSRSKLASAHSALEDVRRAMRLGAYVVAIAGPQRAGKSTLLNAMLREELSPVGDFPTTGAPLYFESGAERSAEAQMPNGVVRAIDADPDSVKAAIAQQEWSSAPRPTSVTVRVPNPRLATGVIIVDCPGLGDADDEVRRVTEFALERADAVLFVVDAGLTPAKFKLSKAEIDHLRYVEDGKDRLFIILNQADLVGPEMLQQTKAYVLGQLEKFGLGKKMVAEPLIVSAREAVEAHRRNEQSPDSFLRLEEQLWGHLLREGATGIHGVHGSLLRIQRAVGEMAALISARRSAGATAGQYRVAQLRCEAAKKQAHGIIQRWERQQTAKFRDRMADFFVKKQHDLEAHLIAHPTSFAPMSSDDLRVWMESLISTYLRSTQQELRSAANDLAAEMTTAVRQATLKALCDLNIQPSIDLESPAPPPLPAVDLSLPEIGFGFVGLLGFLVNPLMGIGATIIGLFVGSKVAQEKRRARAHMQIIKAYQVGVQSVSADLQKQLASRLSGLARSGLSAATARLEALEHDLEEIVADLGEPLDDHEAAALVALEADVVGVGLDAASAATKLLGVIAVSGTSPA